jgi:hypothetical protein
MHFLNKYLNFYKTEKQFLQELQLYINNYKFLNVRARNSFFRKY